MGDPMRDRWPLKGLTKAFQIIEISNKIRDFERLAAALDADLAGAEQNGETADWRDLPVSGRLQFGSGDHGEIVIDGRVQANVRSVCQRCLGVFDWPLVTDLRLMLVGPGETMDDAGEYEFWELDDDTLRPIDLVDEALVMALPLSARHEDDACGSDDRNDSAASEERMTTPFADLRARMDEEHEN